MSHLLPTVCRCEELHVCKLNLKLESTHNPARTNSRKAGKCTQRHAVSVQVKHKPHALEQQEDVNVDKRLIGGRKEQPRDINTTEGPDLQDNCRVEGESTAYSIWVILIITREQTRKVIVNVLCQSTRTLNLKNTHIKILFVTSWVRSQGPITLSMYGRYKHKTKFRKPAVEKKDIVQNTNTRQSRHKNVERLSSDVCARRQWLLEEWSPYRTNNSQTWK